MQLKEKNIYDLLFGKLPEEKQHLANSRIVSSEMEKQWEQVPPGYEGSAKDKQESWQIIKEAIYPSLLTRKYQWMKWYGITATILLCITIGITGYLGSRSNSSPLFYYSYTTGNHSRQVITLPDGSTAILGAQSSLIYPDRFAGGKRTVQLEGQGFFYVEKDKASPFIVQTKNMSVTALGTAFEVFEDTHGLYSEVILLNGLVRIDYPRTVNQEEESFLLYPDQKIVISHNTGKAEIHPETAENYTSWRQYDGLRFTNERLSTILPRLERWYGCKILHDNNSFLNERFSFKVRNESLDRILELVTQSSSVSFRKDEEEMIYQLTERDPDKEEQPRK